MPSFEVPFFHECPYDRFRVHARIDQNSWCQHGCVEHMVPQIFPYIRLKVNFKRGERQIPELREHSTATAAAAATNHCDVSGEDENAGGPTNPGEFLRTPQLLCERLHSSTSSVLAISSLCLGLIAPDGFPLICERCFPKRSLDEPPPPPICRISSLHKSLDLQLHPTS